MSLEKRKSALVLASGGAYAAYEVGVIKALLSGHSSVTGFRPLEPDFIFAMGMGAVNAGILAANDRAGLPEAVSVLEEAWLNHFAETGCGNGLYRIRGLPSEYFNPHCILTRPGRLFRNGVDDLLRAATAAISLAAAPERLRHPLALFRLNAFMDAEPLRRSVRQFVPVEGLRNSRIRLRISALNAATGKVKIFDEQDLIRLEAAPLVASSLPATFFPVEQIDGIPYVDASLLIDTPLRPAIEPADELYVIYMDPDIKRIPVENLQNSIAVFDRFRAVQIAYAFNQDVRTARSINGGLEVMEKADRNEPLSDEDVHFFLRTAGRTYRRLREGKSYRKLTIHCFHPGKDLGGSLGMLNLDRDNLQNTIDEGYRDAVAYDPAHPNLHSVT